MIYTELQKAIIHWSLVALIAGSLVAIVKMTRRVRKQHKEFVEWRKNLERYNWVRVKDFDNPMMVWVNSGEHITLKDGDYYPRVHISNVFPYEQAKWEVTNE